jgi:DNA transformation protein and related proteins
MGASAEFIALLVDLFDGFEPVRTKRMFGGAGLYVGDIMFGLIADDVLFLKADEITAGRFKAEGCGPFTYDGKSKPVVMSYWQVPERLYEDADELAVWAREALGVARAAKRPKPARRTISKSGS